MQVRLLSLLNLVEALHLKRCEQWCVLETFCNLYEEVETGRPRMCKIVLVDNIVTKHMELSIWMHQCTPCVASKHSNIVFCLLLCWYLTNLFEQCDLMVHTLFVLRVICKQIVYLLKCCLVFARS